MSELIATRTRADLRFQLLATVSAFSLLAVVASQARADDSDRPTVWIELGGQMEQAQGMSSPFSAPFMSVAPTPGLYDGLSFLGSQKGPHFAFGEEGKLIFEPSGSDWVFTAGIRYGRSNAKRHRHNQEPGPDKHFQYTLSFTYAGYPYHYSYSGTVNIPYNELADTNAHVRQQHLILDFTAGKDVGLGLFGRNGSSVVNAGVRFASFTSQTTAYMTARPNVNIVTHYYYLPTFGISKHQYFGSFHQYVMQGAARRSFHGIGPTLSWEASAALVGNQEEGELTFDWGINGALLFGKQRAQTSHSTSAMRFYHQAYAGTLYPPRANHSTRSRSVTVPNLGGFAGLSVKYPNLKVSLGYRADFFFGAMDTGIDARSTKDVGFRGPFATVSIGLGG
jgi:hypothetical protein